MITLLIFWRKRKVRINQILELAEVLCLFFTILELLRRFKGFHFNHFGNIFFRGMQFNLLDTFNLRRMSNRKRFSLIRLLDL